jgi:hypothetical protein
MRRPVFGAPLTETTASKMATQCGQAKPADVKGVSGAIWVGHDNVLDRVRNEGFENFSITHELGHRPPAANPEAEAELSKTNGARIEFA